MWIEVSSSVPHFLQVGLLLSPITYKCLHMVLYPVRRPRTTLNCVLLNNNNQVLIACLGPQINPQACLCLLQGPHHNTKCWFSIHRFMFLLIFCVQTPRKAQVQQTVEQNRPLRLCRRFHFLALRHAQGPNISSQRVGQRYRSLPSGTFVPRVTLVWQPVALSEPPLKPYVCLHQPKHRMLTPTHNSYGY